MAAELEPQVCWSAEAAAAAMPALTAEAIASIARILAGVEARRDRRVDETPIPQRQAA